MKRLLTAATCFASVLVGLPPPASAMDRFEIQVYEPDMNKPGQFALELHSNYIIKGARQSECHGQVPADRAAQFTAPFFFGINVEVGRVPRPDRSHRGATAREANRGHGVLSTTTRYPW